MSDDFQKRFDRITKKNFRPARRTHFIPVFAVVVLIGALLALIGGLMHAAVNPLPRLVEIDRSKAPIQTGIHHKKFWLGYAVSETIHYQDGVRQGRTTQYYPNGATYRELKYNAGRLDGTQREYEQKVAITLNRRMGRPVTGAGPLRWKRKYRAGIRID